MTKDNFEGNAFGCSLQLPTTIHCIKFYFYL